MNNKSMPILTIVAQAAVEAQRNQLSLISSQALVNMTEPIRQAQKAMATLAFPIEILQKSFSASITLPLIKAMDTHTKIYLQMAKNPFLGFSDIASIGMGIFPKDLFTAPTIINAILPESHEISQHVLHPSVALPQERAIVPALPQRIPYRRTTLGLKEIAGGSFQYKRKILKKLSHRNCEGRLLSLFLSYSDCYINDDDVHEKLHIPDGRSFSWVLRNLKRKLRINGLTATIERRWNPDGYILIDIQYLQ